MVPQSARNTPAANGTIRQAKANDKGLSRAFSQIANRIARETGRLYTFMFALGMIIIWAATGPIFHYSDTWQLVINTGTTIVTFLMVFLIQNSQNRDSAAIQVKLKELIRVSDVHNKFVGIERLTEEVLQDIRSKCERRAKTRSAAADGTTERKAEKATSKTGH